MKQKINIALVHGAWGDGSHWRKVIPILTAAGYTVGAVQNPLTSLGDDSERTRRLVESFNGPTLLVGHSYGGAVITEAAGKSDQVVGLVYIAAFAPDADENLGMLLGRTDPPAGAAALRPDKYGFLWIDKTMFAENFAQDCDAKEAMVMALAQKPTSGSCFQNTPDHIGWRSLPTWYQVSENDRMIPPVTQRFFAERMKAETISLASSHASMASHPEEIAAFIIKAAKKLEG